MDEQANTETPAAESVYQRTLEQARARRQQALQLRNGTPKKTFKEIGRALGVSTERARQMVNQAMEEGSA